MLLPTSYLAPISYYALLLKADSVTLEQYEHFPKQTFRNRCSIYSPNGMQQLIVPLDGRKDKTLTKDIRISYEMNWQMLHWRSLEAAYRSSPYFEYYEDDLREFYESRTEFLSEFNLKLMKRMMELLKIKKDISLTTQYEKIPTNCEDHRDVLTKKNIAFKNEMPRYMQVFENKNGFLPNLGIADLLFNLGPNSAEYLQQLPI